MNPAIFTTDRLCSGVWRSESAANRRVVLSAPNPISPLRGLRHFPNIYLAQHIFPFNHLPLPLASCRRNRAATFEVGTLPHHAPSTNRAKLASFLHLPSTCTDAVRWVPLGSLGSFRKCKSFESKDFLGSLREFAYTPNRQDPPRTEPVLSPTPPHLGRVTPGLVYDIFNASSGFRTQSGGDCPREAIRCHS